MPKLMRACSTVAMDGAVYFTNSERVKKVRKIALELLMSDHEGDCKGPCTLNCPAGTDCQGYVKAIAEAFQQAIPYSQILVFSSGGKYLLFESYPHADAVNQYQFSDWVYEEELLIDYSFGIKRESAAVVDPKNRETWSYLPERLSGIFHAATYSGYLCVRRLIDILRIRELQYGKELIHPIIAKLIEYGKIEYFDDTPYVTWSDADSLYGRFFPHKFWPSIEDGRFGIDRRFEPLTTGDFASYEETLNLLEEIEFSIPNHGYDPGRYSVEDDEYNDDPERYGDDEDYDYMERYDDYD
jgi:hypothetical protein